MNTTGLAKLTMPLPADFSIEKDVLEILEVASTRLGNGHEGAKRFIANAIALLATKIGRAHGLAGEARRDNTLSCRQMQRICEYIDQHIEQPIEVTELADVVNRSSAHFSRIFKRTLGVTPHAYVTQRRITLAGRLLVETNLAMCDIALRCGFSDQAHFARRFRSSMGTKPTSWRRAMGDKEKAVDLENQGREAEALRARLLNAHKPPVLSPSQIAHAIAQI
jgi:AraC-like DNA-binding protein